MAKKSIDVIKYFENLYNSKSIYCWGANGEIMTPELATKLYNMYHNNTYNKKYYDEKLKEGLNKIVADCSGAMRLCPDLIPLLRDITTNALPKEVFLLSQKIQPV